MGSGAGARREDERLPHRERPPLGLALAGARAPARSAADAPSESLLDDAKAMALAEWAYFNVEEVWSAFNLLSEAVARGFRVVVAPSSPVVSGEAIRPSRRVVSGEPQRADVNGRQPGPAARAQGDGSGGASRGASRRVQGAAGAAHGREAERRAKESPDKEGGPGRAGQAAQGDPRGGGTPGSQTAAGSGRDPSPAGSRSPQQAAVHAWAAAVHLPDKVRMMVKNALVYGRCVMEVGPDFLKVRNPRFMDLEQAESGALVGAWQQTPAGPVAVPVERVKVFTLHRLFSDDLRGVSAVHPVLQTLDDMLEARKVNRAVAKRYRAPIRIIELPHDATERDQDALAAQLEETPPDMDIVLPPGARVHVLNHGKDLLQPDALMKEHLTDRIFLGLGVPKVALGLPDGSNRNVSEVQRELLLASKVAPYQRVVKTFVEQLCRERFGWEVSAVFDPVDVRDEREIAEVSRVLVETGVKTAKEVGDHYWTWGSA